MSKDKKQKSPTGMTPEEAVNIQANRYGKPGKGYDNAVKLINALARRDPAKLKKHFASARAFKKMSHFLGGDLESVLCIGCRNDLELRVFEKLGLTATGIDVIESEYANVRKMDAHSLDKHFEENSFDVVYASHSLEHMHSPDEVLRGIRKVAKKGAWITLPYDKKPTKYHPTIMQVMKDDDRSFNATGHQSEEVAEYDIQAINELMGFKASRITYKEFLRNMDRYESLLQFFANHQASFGDFFKISPEEYSEAVQQFRKDLVSVYLSHKLHDFEELKNYTIEYFKVGSNFNKNEFSLLFKFV